VSGAIDWSKHLRLVEMDWGWGSMACGPIVARWIPLRFAPPTPQELIERMCLGGQPLLSADRAMKSLAFQTDAS
jgi:hypothetical protein